MVISAILKGRVDSNGKLPVCIRISDGKKPRKFKTTPIRVRPEQWEGGEIVNHPQAGRLNDVIKAKIEEAQRRYNMPGADDMLEDFYKYADQCFRLWQIKNMRKDTTIEQYKSKMNVLKGWYPKLKIDDIDKKWCERLHLQLKHEGLEDNTIWNYFKTLSVILNKAIDDHIILRNEVKHYKDKPVYKDPSKIYLTKHDIQQLERYAAVATPERRHAACWFLIGCYTGLRHSDMVTFDKKRDVVGGRLVKVQVKTGNTVSLPVEGKIKELFAAVEWKPLQVQNQPFNRLMKKIAEDVELEMNITCHTSRHTCGMMLAEAGVSIEITAAILGHKDTKATKVYYHLTNKRVDNEMMKILEM